MNNIEINPPVTILPKGIKGFSDILDSKGYKSFLKKESQKPKEKPKFPLLQNGSVITGGTGRSFIDEYLNTLPTIPFNKLATSKKALGRTVVILDIKKVFEPKSDSLQK